MPISDEHWNNILRIMRECREWCTSTPERRKDFEAYCREREAESQRQRQRDKAEFRMGIFDQ